MIIKRIIRRCKNYLFSKRNLNIGKNTRVLTSIAYFGSEPYLVKIGSNCTITSGVMFITHDASIGIVLKSKNIDRIVDDKKYELMAPIEVFDNCMIGINSIILPGVKIGPNSIVGAGSVVTKDVPEGVVVGGNPAKFICSIDDFYDKASKKMFLVKKGVSYDARKKDILENLSQT